MSAYFSRYCRLHGDWKCDVDNPDDECPECERSGIAPSQLVYKLRLEAASAAALLEDDLSNGHGGETRAGVAREIRAILAALEKP